MKNKSDLEQEAVRVIGNLNFEKAFTIIYNRKIPTDAEREKECEKTGESRFNKLAYRFTEDSEPTEFEPSKIVDSKERVIEERDAIIKAYEIELNLLHEETSDPEYNKDLIKQGIYKIVIQNEDHYNTLKQLPTGWRNLDLFAHLWAYAELTKMWVQSNFTHREQQLAHEYRVEAGLEKFLTATELRRISEGRYQQSLTLNKGNSKKYRAPSKQELSNAILLLKGYPEAIKLAESDLKKLF